MTTKHGWGAHPSRKKADDPSVSLTGSDKLSAFAGGRKSGLTRRQPSLPRVRFVEGLQPGGVEYDLRERKRGE